MTKGIRDLRQIEIGFQGVGTGVVCDTPAVTTERVVGICGMKKTPTLVFPTEATGLMSDHIINRAYEPFVMAELPLTPGDEGLTYEQIVYYLSMGVKGGVTGVAGVGADRVWTFAPDLAVGDFPEVATIHYGDNAQVWRSNCCFARQLIISAAYKAPWQIEADVIGRDMEVHAFDGHVYPTPLHVILGQLTSFYVEDGCTDIHDTPVAKKGTLIDWRLTIPGFHPKFFQEGELYYTAIGLDSRHLTLEATIEFDSVVAAAEHADWILRTPRYMRLQAVGDLIGAGVYYTVTIDLNVMYESFDTLDQRDGNDIIRFVARTVYDVGCVAVPEWQIVVTNIDPALP